MGADVTDKTPLYCENGGNTAQEGLVQLDKKCQDKEICTDDFAKLQHGENFVEVSGDSADLNDSSRLSHELEGCVMSSSPTADKKPSLEQRDAYASAQVVDRRTPLFHDSSAQDIFKLKEPNASPSPPARTGLDYCITVPVESRRNLFREGIESGLSRSMTENKGSPMHDLKLDKLSKRDEQILIRNLIKVQTDGTVEVDISKSAPIASELFELHSVEGSLPALDRTITYCDRSIPKLKIVMLVVGTRGDVQPFLAMAKKLQEFGHRVRLATHANFRSFVKSNGIDFFPLGGDPRVLAGYMARNKGLLSSSPGDISIQRKQLKAIIESLLPACTEPDIETGEPFRAQAIIANPPAYEYVDSLRSPMNKIFSVGFLRRTYTGHTHVAEALGVPLHIFFTMPWTPTYEFPHPLARVPNSAGYWLSYIIVDLVVWWTIRGYINNFRKKKLKLAPIAYFSMYYGSISHLPTGYMWSPHVVPKPNDWGPQVDVVGYCFLNLGSKYQPAKDFVQWIQRGSKPIYIGFGSMPLEDSNKTTDVILEALKNTGERGIIDRGWGDLGTYPEIPDNVYLLEDCPHDWLFPQCSAVVHHGGAGTTATGLRAGCPTTIVPFFGDQIFWGDRIHKKGLGPAPVPISLLTVDTLSDAIRFMLQPEVKSRAVELAKLLENEDGVLAAVDAFHRHLPAEIPSPAAFEEKDYTDGPNPLQWLLIQIGKVCSLSCGGS